MLSFRCFSHLTLKNLLNLNLMSENVMVYREPVYFFLLEALFLQLLAFEEHTKPKFRFGKIKMLSAHQKYIGNMYNMYIHKVLGL